MISTPHLSKNEIAMGALVAFGAETYYPSSIISLNPTISALQVEAGRLVTEELDADTDNRAPEASS